MFTLFDQTDPTKQMRFNVAAIPTASLAIMTVPYAGSGTFAIAQHNNNFSAKQTMSQGSDVYFDDTNGLTLHRELSGTTGPALRWESQIGAGFTLIDSKGQFPTRNIYFCDQENETGLMNIDMSGFGNELVTMIVPKPTTADTQLQGIIALDTSILCHDGDVLTYDDDLLTI